MYTRYKYTDWRDIPMEENQFNGQKIEDEIDLRDLFMALWKRKVMIISFTLIAAIVTGLISVFLITPVYHSRLNIVISMPENYHTKYGDYTLPITSNEQYINLITNSAVIARTIEDMGYDSGTTIESICDRITIDKIDTKSNTIQNSFFVRVSANNPAEAQELAQTLFDNYVEFLDVLTVEGAIDFYISKFRVELEAREVSLNTTKEILAKNEALLAATPQTISQAAAMEEIEKAPSTSEYIVLENVINPNYTKIEHDIIANKQSINSIENSMRVYNEYLIELEAMKEKIASYNESGDYSELESDIVSITKTNVYLPSEPIVPSRKTSPSNARNVIIGALLGGMVGVLVALVRHYWFKPE